MRGLEDLKRLASSGQNEFLMRLRGLLRAPVRIVYEKEHDGWHVYRYATNRHSIYKSTTEFIYSAQLIVHCMEKGYLVYDEED